MLHLPNKSSKLGIIRISTMDTIIRVYTVHIYSIKIERIAWAETEWIDKGLNIAHSIK